MRFPRIFSLIALLGLVACGGAPRDVLYESSRAHIFFQAIPLSALFASGSDKGHSAETDPVRI